MLTVFVTFFMNPLGKCDLTSLEVGYLMKMV